MRPGLFPSQQRALEQAFKKARALDRFRQKTRRSFILGGFAAIGAATTTFFLGARYTGTAAQRGPQPLTQPDATLSALHGLALGPLDQLEAQEMHVVRAYEANVLDDKLAYGVQRLVALSLSKPTNEVLRVRLVRLISKVDLPEHVRSSLDLLKTAAKR